MVLFICYNAAYNAKKRSKYVKDIFIISFVAITRALLTLSILLLLMPLPFTPIQIIPITGKIAGNAMIATGLCYNQFGQRFENHQQQIQEMLSLGAT